MKNTPQECAKTSAFTFWGVSFLFDMFWVIEEDGRPVYYCAIMMTFNLFAN